MLMHGANDDGIYETKNYCVHNRTRLEIRSYECIDLSLTE